MAMNHSQPDSEEFSESIEHDDDEDDDEATAAARAAVGGDRTQQQQEMGSGSSSSSSSSSSGGEDDDDDDDDDDDEDDDGESTMSSDESASETAHQTSAAIASHPSKATTVEVAQIEGTTLHLPRLMCEHATIFHEFFSFANWQTLVPPAVQQRLQHLLPDFSGVLEPHECAAATDNTLQMLFNGSLTRFGHTPIVDIQRHLEAGDYRPDVLRVHENVVKARRREQRFRQCESIGRLVKQLYLSREQVLSSAQKAGPEKIKHERPLKHPKRPSVESLYNELKTQTLARSRKRFHADLQQILTSAACGPLSADEEDAPSAEELRQDAKAKRRAMSCAASAIATASYAVAERCVYGTAFKRHLGLQDDEAVRCDHYAKQPRLCGRTLQQYLMQHKRKKLSETSRPEYDTSDIRLLDICSRAHMGADFKRQFLSGRAPGRKPKNPKWTKLQNQNGPTQVAPADMGQAQSTADPNALYDGQRQSLGALNGLAAVGMAVAPQTDGIFMHDGSFHMLDGDVDLQQEEVATFEGTIPTFVTPTKATTVTAVHSLTGSGAVSTATADIVGDRLLPPLEPLRSPAEMGAKSTTETDASGTPTMSSDLVQSTHASFFSLLRDFFCATPNHRLRYGELNERVANWLYNPITALNSWYPLAADWSALLQPAMNFLAANCSRNELPAEFVAYVDYRSPPQDFYQWIGAGRDSDARLTALCEFWLQQLRRRAQGTLPAAAAMEVTAAETFTDVLDAGGAVASVNRTNTATSDAVISSSPPPPPPRCPTSWTVRPATVSEVAEFQRQERARFERPHRAFTYRMYGYESVVGPLKGIYTPQQLPVLAKPRGHSMMIGDRPNFVTILTLVRDATARLPNGEGTRADISELLKCSQYISRDAAENVLQTIVSGALDRMHTEQDACVRYDARRKMWIYLHRDRTEAEFERSHQQQQHQVGGAVGGGNGVAVCAGHITAAANTMPGVSGDGGLTTTTAAPGRGKKLVQSGLAGTGTTQPSQPRKTLKTRAPGGVGLAASADDLPPSFSLPSLVPSAKPPIVIQQKGQPNTVQPGHMGAASPATMSAKRQSALVAGAGGGGGGGGSAGAIKGLPVPPLKYNIPPAVVGMGVAPQQTSLLKPNMQAVQQRQHATVVAGKAGPPMASNAAASSGVQAPPARNVLRLSGGPQLSNSAPNTVKQFHLTVQQMKAAQAAVGSTTAAAARATTPIMVSTPGGGLQTVHVANSTVGAATTVGSSKNVLSLGGRLTTAGQQQQTVATPSMARVQLTTAQTLAAPPAAGSNKQASPGVFMLGPGISSVSMPNTTSVAATSMPSQTSPATAAPKSFIRLMPAQQQQQQPTSAAVGGTKATNVHLIGQRVIAGAGTAGGAAQVQPRVISAGGGGGGAVLRVSPQAYAALQQQKQGAGGAVQQVQQQQQQHTTTAMVQHKLQQQQKQQQRILVGNAGIVSSGALGATKTAPTVYKTVAGVQQQQQQHHSPAQQRVVAGVPKLGNVQQVNAANLQPQQQQPRLLLQNTKQQQQQQQQQPQHQQLQYKTVQVVTSSAGRIPTANAAAQPQVAAAGGGGAAATTMRMLPRSQMTIATPVSANSSSSNSRDDIGGGTRVITTSTGQIVSLESILQKQGGGLRLSSAGGGTVGQQTRNVITIGGGGGGGGVVQRTVQKTTPAATGGTFLKTADGRLVSTAANATTTTGGSPGSVRLLNPLQAKQLIFTTGGGGAAGQAANTRNVASTVAAIAGGAAGGQLRVQQQLQQQHPTQQQQQPQMQTVIMGNQILRLQMPTATPAGHVLSSGGATRTVNIGDVVSTAGVPAATTTNAAQQQPKTIVLGAAGQTLRLQPTATAKQNPASASVGVSTANLSGAQQRALGNRVMLAVQGGGQIILSGNNTISLKALQNMKVVSLASGTSTSNAVTIAGQQQQQQQRLPTGGTGASSAHQQQQQ